MNRKAFLMGTVAISLIPVFSSVLKTFNVDPLATPTLLMKIFSSQEIIQLGMLELHDNPRTETELKLELLNSIKVTEITLHNIDQIEQLIKVRVSQDFSNSVLTNLNGWIISKTEARQCALSYLYKIKENAY